MKISESYPLAVYHVYCMAPSRGSASADAADLNNNWGGSPHEAAVRKFLDPEGCLKGIEIRFKVRPNRSRTMGRVITCEIEDYGSSAKSGAEDVLVGATCAYVKSRLGGVTCPPTAFKVVKGESMKTTESRNLREGLGDGDTIVHYTSNGSPKTQACTFVNTGRVKRAMNDRFGIYDDPWPQVFDFLSYMLDFDKAESLYEEWAEEGLIGRDTFSEDPIEWANAVLQDCRDDIGADIKIEKVEAAAGTSASKAADKEERVLAVLDGVLGQLSDGMWEDSPRMEKYWRGVKASDILKMPPVKKLAYARLVKEVIKEEGCKWDRGNMEESEYLSNGDTPVTVRDAYYTYELLKGRNVDKHPEYESAEAEVFFEGQSYDQLKADALKRLGDATYADDDALDDAISSTLDGMPYNVDKGTRNALAADLFDELESRIGCSEALGENNTSSDLPPAIDSFLQSVAQIYTDNLSYNDIIEFGKRYTPADLKALRSCRKVVNEIGDEEDPDVIDAVNMIVKIVKG